MKQVLVQILHLHCCAFNTGDYYLPVNKGSVIDGGYSVYLQDIKIAFNIQFLNSHVNLCCTGYLYMVFTLGAVIVVMRVKW